MILCDHESRFHHRPLPCASRPHKDSKHLCFWDSGSWSAPILDLVEFARWLRKYWHHWLWLSLSLIGFRMKHNIDLMFTIRVGIVYYYHQLVLLLFRLESGEAVVTKPRPSYEAFRLWALVMIVSTSEQYQKRFNCPKSSTEVAFVVSNFWTEISKIFDLVNDSRNDKYLTKKSNLVLVLSKVYYVAGIRNMIWGGIYISKHLKLY